MKIAFLICLLFTVGCNFYNESKEPYSFLNDNSKLNFSHKEIDVVKFKVEKSGFKDEGIIQGVYDINSFNITSLIPELKKLNYKNLPIINFDEGNRFDGNFSNSDTGYYKITISNMIIQKLIIVDFTKRKIIVYKLINQ